MNPSQDASNDLEADDPIEESWEAEHFGIPAGGWRRRLFVVVFGTNTRLGRSFDLVLLLLILASTAVVMADSVASISQRHHDTLAALEWFFTVAFTLEENCWTDRFKTEHRELQLQIKDIRIDAPAS